MNEKELKKIEVCFTPELYQYYKNENAVVVVSDILRATTSICAAFENGAKELIPVATLDEAREYKAKGYLVAAERDGIVIDFADFGNSPFNFTPERVNGKSIVYSTTNGTKTLMMASGSRSVVAGAFINLSSLSQFLINSESDVLIFCSGWKGRFNLEDSLFAGALATLLINSGKYLTICDSATAAIDLWTVAAPDLRGYMEKAAHRHRLKRLGLDDVMDYACTLDLTEVVPVLNGNVLINHND